MNPQHHPLKCPSSIGQLKPVGKHPQLTNPTTESFVNGHLVSRLGVFVKKAVGLDLFKICVTNSQSDAVEQMGDCGCCGCVNSPYDWGNGGWGDWFIVIEPWKQNPIQDSTHSFLETSERHPRASSWPGSIAVLPKLLLRLQLLPIIPQLRKNLVKHLLPPPVVLGD